MVKWPACLSSASTIPVPILLKPTYSFSVKCVLKRRKRGRVWPIKNNATSKRSRLKLILEGLDDKVTKKCKTNSVQLKMVLFT